ncbi:MAG: DUF5060 domain-containing protein [Prolixibacteraceae bacterium]
MKNCRLFITVLTFIWLSAYPFKELCAENQLVKQWAVFEVEMKASIEGNPFDVELFGTFQHEDTTFRCRGFYDGNNSFKVRFMPSLSGEWKFKIESANKNLNKRTGQFTCVPNSKKQHGIVQVRDTFHFGYSDGTPFFPIGTTSYVWNLQGDSLAQLTLNTLGTSPFNKIRMCVFPKDYDWNKNEPETYPFQGNPPNQWDFSKFNPAYFQTLEKRILQLHKLGIQADLILFHPYDFDERWGFHEMETSTDIRYLKYIVARLSAYSNVWWSMANEYDLMKAKTDSIWDEYFQVIQKEDPYHHLLSIHNGPKWYDHSKPWISHLSIQHQNLKEVVDFRDKYQKPIIIDECGYEGDIPWVWGNLTAQELVHRFWLGYSRGCYVTHGETYLDSLDILWWSKGGKLHGESVKRIEFLKEIIENGPSEGINPPTNGYWHKRGGSFKEPDYYLYYLGNTQPAYLVLELPDKFTYSAEIIDTWEMTTTKLKGTYTGKCKVVLPGKDRLTLIMRRVKQN